MQLINNLSCDETAPEAQGSLARAPLCLLAGLFVCFCFVSFCLALFGLLLLVRLQLVFTCLHDVFGRHPGIRLVRQLLDFKRRPQGD